MNLFQEVHRGFRALGSAPGLTALVVLTLTIGIAATTAIFTVVYAIVLRPLPFPEADRLVRICETNEAVADYCVASPPDVMDWKRQSRTFEELGLGRYTPAVLRNEVGSEIIMAAIATPGYLQIFRATPILGRLLEPKDLDLGQPPVVVLDYDFWQARFAGDPEIINETLTLDGRIYNVVGVLASGLEMPGLNSAEVWLPLPFLGEEHRQWRGFKAVGRLWPNVTLNEARSEMKTIAARLAQQYPATNQDWGVALTDLREEIVGGTRQTLLIFLGAGIFVLLIGCANVANLLLSRGIARQREMAVRAALGARRSRLVRLLMIENLLLAAMGGIGGLALSHVLIETFLGFAPKDIPRLAEVTIDAGIFAAAATVTLISCLLFGLIPALRSTTPDLTETLKSGTRELSASRGARLRGLLVVAEIALALMLLIGAGLVTRSFVAASRWQGGFDHENLLALWLLWSETKYPHENQLANIYQQSIDDLRTLPGVLSVGAASSGPLFGTKEPAAFIAKNSPSQEPRTARWSDVDSKYFRTLGIPLLKGRYFTAADDGNAPAVAIVNATLASRFWPGEDPIGKRIQATDENSTRQVVGVVADVKPLWPEAQVASEIYWPYLQKPRWATFLVIRTANESSVIVDAIRKRLGEIDQDASVSRVQFVRQRIKARLVWPHFNMLLLTTFAFVALILALGGVYGVISYGVSCRTREIGLRMALGAGRPQILRAVIGQGLKLTAIGILFGLLGAFALTRLLASMLYDTRSTEPLTFLFVIALLTLAAGLACCLPALRAARVDPMVAIRCE